jgi:hypothetical protein
MLNLLSAVAAAGVLTARPAPAPSFRNHVLPVLTKAACNSGACHGALAGKGGLKLTLRGYDPEADYAALTRQAAGRRVLVGRPDDSLLLQKPSLAVAHGGGMKLKRGSADYAVAARWIAMGAPGPRASDPSVLRLEVSPITSRLPVGAEQRIKVSAVYSDGHREDVTRWTKFGAADTAVATVDDFGKAKVAGPGETAITVWFNNKVSFARIVSPFPNAPNPAVYASAPRANRIDDLILNKLQSLGIQPSATCTDGEFIPRVSLDIAGVLPTPAEAAAFIADPSPGKRTRLVDSLLARPEYVDYWTYKWSDLLLVNSRKLAGKSLTSFYNWIRESVASNKGWDRMARELITARGSNLENGAANFYVLHREPIDLTETFTQAFLGMSVQCARCHNHPMEKWTQRDYYHLANLLSRVRLKNGDQAGEVLVLSSSTGDIPHPRLSKPLPPKPLDGVEMPAGSSRDRREYLAEWLTAPDNPYFGRAVINRVWRSLMGRGLVEAEDDLRLTNPCSNEELMAYLNDEFVRSGFDIRRLIRQIVTSEAYGRSSVPTGNNARDDRYYARFLVKRLPAEVLLDAISHVTGVPTAFEGYPRGTRALQLRDSQVSSYFLTAFGRPERVQTCSCERQSDPSVAQALHLANGDTINRKLAEKGSVVDRLLAERAGDGEALNALFLAAYSRTPTEKERAKLLPVLASAPLGSTAESLAARKGVLEDLAWAILTDNEFLFNH